jgi:hypothetical protein
MKWRSGSPSRESRVVPSGGSRAPAGRGSRRSGSFAPLRQWTHSPHSGAKRVITWSPGATSVTPSPYSLDDSGALVAEDARA